MEIFCIFALLEQLRLGKIPPPNFFGGGILGFNYLTYSELRAAENGKRKAESGKLKNSIFIQHNKPNFIN